MIFKKLVMEFNCFYLILSILVITDLSHPVSEPLKQAPLFLLRKMGAVILLI